MEKITLSSRSSSLPRLAVALLAAVLTLVGFVASARAEVIVDLTPPSGTLFDPGGMLVWNTKSYDVSFSSSTPISALEWKINLAATQTIAVRIYNSAKTLIASGTPVPGTGSSSSCALR